MSALHVRTETRKVYVSARGTKLTKHAAYIAAAKELVARRCAAIARKRMNAIPPEQLEENGFEFCDKNGAYQCRFHRKHTGPVEVDYDGYSGTVEGDIGMAYYCRVLPRLVRFLKYVDRKRTERRP